MFVSFRASVRIWLYFEVIVVSTTVVWEFNRFTSDCGICPFGVEF